MGVDLYRRNAELGGIAFRAGRMGRHRGIVATGTDGGHRLCRGGGADGAGSNDLDPWHRCVFVALLRPGHVQPYPANSHGALVRHHARPRDGHRQSGLHHRPNPFAASGGFVDGLDRLAHELASGRRDLVAVHPAAAGLFAETRPRPARRPWRHDRRARPWGAALAQARGAAPLALLGVGAAHADAGLCRHGRLLSPSSCGRDQGLDAGRHGTRLSGMGAVRGGGGLCGGLGRGPFRPGPAFAACAAAHGGGDRPDRDECDTGGLDSWRRPDRCDPRHDQHRLGYAFARDLWHEPHRIGARGGKCRACRLDRTWAGHGRCDHRRRESVPQQAGAMALWCFGLSLAMLPVMRRIVRAS